MAKREFLEVTEMLIKGNSVKTFKGYQGYRIESFSYPLSIIENMRYEPLTQEYFIWLKNGYLMKFENVNTVSTVNKKKS